MDAITRANRDGHFKGILTVTQAYHLECHNMVVSIMDGLNGH